MRVPASDRAANVDTVLPAAFGHMHAAAKVQHTQRRPQQ
jgi:hypothetical protein